MKTPEIIYVLTLMAGMFVGVKGDDIVNRATGPSFPEDSTPKYCGNFTNVDWLNKQFTSPFYPGSYPNNTDCTQILVAPEGSRIRLDFRDKFHIEHSEDCQYDFLEIRDGPFGYSKLLGKYCGKEHPQMIDSSSRFLWIRFKSDDSIEYRGFKAVFDTYLPGPTPDIHPEDLGNNHTKQNPEIGTPGTWWNITDETVCMINIDTTSSSESTFNSSIITKIRKKKQTEDGNEAIDCTFVIYAKPKNRVFFHWKSYKMKENDCDFRYIDIYEGTTASIGRTKQFCGGFAKDFRSQSNHVYVRIYAGSADLIPKFDALITVSVEGPCVQDTFDCGDGTCIERSLVCNKKTNCIEDWDETNCNPVVPVDKPDEKEVGMGHFHKIVLSVVGSIIFVVILISIFLTCKQHKNEQRRRKHALRQEERQAIEHEMTNLLNGSPRPGHLRAANRSVQPRVNGAIPGTSHRLSSVSDSKDPRNNPVSVDIYFENHLPHGGMKRLTDSEYSHYLRMKENEFNSPLQQHNPHVVHYEGHFDSNTPPGGILCLDKSKLRRALSDKAPRSRTPSPRPDVVQEETYFSPYGKDIVYMQRHARTLSADMLISKSENESSDQQKYKPDYRGYNQCSTNGYSPYNDVPSNIRGQNIYNNGTSKSLPHLSYKQTYTGSPKCQPMHYQTYKDSPDIHQYNPSRNYPDYGHVKSVPGTRLSKTPPEVRPIRTPDSRQVKTPPESRHIKLDPGYRTVVTQLPPQDELLSRGGTYVNYHVETLPPSKVPPPPPERLDSNYRKAAHPLYETHFPSVDYSDEPTVPVSSNYAISSAQRCNTHSKRDKYFSTPKRNEVRHAPV